MGGCWKVGFRWFCNQCTLETEQLKLDIQDNVKSMLSEFWEEMSIRMKTLQLNVQCAKTVTKYLILQEFAEVIKKAVIQSMYEWGSNGHVVVRMNATGTRKVVHTSKCWW